MMKFIVGFLLFGVFYSASVGADCVDTVDWDNGHLDGDGNVINCQTYAENYCENGAVKSGEEWTLGSYSNWPEYNCCVCNTGICSTDDDCASPESCKDHDTDPDTRTVCTTGSYVLTDTGEVCTDKTLVGSEDECKIAASDLGLVYSKSVSTTRYPAGCIYGFSKAYWNTASSGSASGRIQAICKGD